MLVFISRKAKKVDYSTWLILVFNSCVYTKGIHVTDTMDKDYALNTRFLA